MADTKASREQQARMAERRQRELEMREELSRLDEQEPQLETDDVIEL